MEIAFYIAAAIAVISTLMVITQVHPVHALLYMILSLLSAAVVIFTLGSPFLAVLEVIIYAGAIMVLFLFVVMLLNLGRETAEQERQWLVPRYWLLPSLLALVLLVEVAYVLFGSSTPLSGVLADPKQLSLTLFGPYVLGVELTSILLTAGLVGAYHLGRRMELISRDTQPASEL
jgi:NADH-quinone oxidoreductase subunit J